jgi:hypothetical protein
MFKQNVPSDGGGYNTGSPYGKGPKFLYTTLGGCLPFVTVFTANLFLLELPCLSPIVSFFNLNFSLINIEFP